METDKQGVEKMENIDIEKLKAMSMPDLSKIAKSLKINSISGMKKQELIFKILQGKTSEPTTDSRHVPSLRFSKF